MARTEIICPYCQKPQTLPDKVLHEPWRCMQCQGTIDDPFLHKKKSPPPKLQIPLHGKIISASGVTNLSEITAASEEYSPGFDPSTIRIPGQFELTPQAPPVYKDEVKKRTMTIVLAVIFTLVIAACLTAYYFLVMSSASNQAP
jgi:hypothetical protein